MMKGMVAMVTGGAGGIGKATVQRFVKEGAKAVILDLPSSKGAEIATEMGPDVTFVPTDVVSESDVENALTVTDKTYGRLDVLVNCAAVAVAYKTYNIGKRRSHQLEDFNRVMAVNVTGTFNVIRLASDLLSRNNPDEDGQRGVIITTSSFAATEGQEAQVAFAVTQGAIASMTLPLTRDLSDAGIRVCCISTGLIKTPLIDFYPEKVSQYFKLMTPFPKRLGKPDEYASLAVHIVQNPFLNGAIIRLDGALRLM